MSLPTGCGKSLCYAVLPGVFDILHKRTSPTLMIVVMSPLIALMKDQVGIFQKRGINAVYVNPSDKEMRHEVTAGNFQIMYISSETLQHHSFRQL